MCTGPGRVNPSIFWQNLGLALTTTTTWDGAHRGLGRGSLLFPPPLPFSGWGGGAEQIRRRANCIVWIEFLNCPPETP